VRGCFGSKGVVRLGVIETMRGNSGSVSIGGGIGSSGRNDNEPTGGDACGVLLWKGGTSHGRGMRSRDEGPKCFFTGGRDGGNGISSGVGDLFHGAGMIGVASCIGGDGVSDWGKCRELTTLWVARLNNGTELKVTDPKEQQGDIEEEEAEGEERRDGVDGRGQGASC